MGKTIGNQFGAFGTLSLTEKGPREERVFIANGTIVQYGAVAMDFSSAAAIGKVVVPGTNDDEALIGVAQNAAVAGEEVVVVTSGPSLALGSAVVAAGAKVGATATTATTKAAVAPSATICNLGFALEATANGSNTWIYVQIT